MCITQGITYITIGYKRQEMTTAITYLYNALHLYATEIESYLPPYLIYTDVGEYINARTIIPSVAHVDYRVTYVHTARPTVIYCMCSIYKFIAHVPPWRKNSTKR